MTPADRRSVTVALTSLAVKGKTNCFCSDGKLSRGDAARLVAMAGQVPQTIPTAQPSPMCHPPIHRFRSWKV